MIVQQELARAVSTWEEAETLARCATDRMGCPIDQGILETVVALNLFGLRTCQSCEGHLDHGTPYPWVDIETDEFPAFKQALEKASQEDLSVEEREAEGVQLVSIASNLPSRGVVYAHLENLLNGYYQRCSPFSEEWRIIIDWRSPILFRLMSFYAFDADE